jgi:TetR/AcrR family transcriptional regulator, transcriptional repressor for nem operon
MARHKAFDPDAVLEKAMQVFWQKGYEATSIQDLVAAMGINRGSLYATFQDKRQLFLRAIAHYSHTALQQAIGRLQTPGSARQAIADYFYSLVQALAAQSPCQGCLMTNTIVELSLQDAEIAAQLKQSLLTLEEAFYAALLRAKAQAEINPKADLRTLARYLTASVQGLQVISKVDPGLDSLRDMVKTILMVLD